MSDINNNNNNVRTNNDNEWRYSLKDEERNQNVIRFFTAVKIFDDNRINDAQQHSGRLEAAKNWEIEVFDKASSKEEYDHIIAEKLKVLTKNIQQVRQLHIQQQMRQQNFTSLQQLQQQQLQQQQQQILRQMLNFIHSPDNNNNQNIMNFTNTSDGNTVIQNNPQLNFQLNPSSIMFPQINQRIANLNNDNKNSNNNNSSYENKLAIIKPEETIIALDIIKDLDVKAREKKIQHREIIGLTDDEKAKIREKLDLLKPMFNNVDKVLPYFYHFTKSQNGTQRLLYMKYLVDDQLKALPGKYLLSLKAVDMLLEQFSKYFLFVKAKGKGINDEFSTNVISQNMSKKVVSPTLPTLKYSANVSSRKHKLESGQQEGQSPESTDNLDKKRMFEVNNNSSGNVNNMDLEYNNSPKDYDKEASFDDITESIKHMMTAVKGVLDAGIVKESDQNPLTYLGTGSGLACISKTLSKSA